MMTKSDNSTMAGVLMIASGVLTVIGSASLFFTLVWVCVGVLWLVPLAIGVGEIAVGAAIMGGRANHRVRGMSVAGILGALMCGNLFSVGLEIVSLALLANSSRDSSLLSG